MAAATKDRDAKFKISGDRRIRAFPVAASTIIYKGTMVMLDANGRAIPAAVASGAGRPVVGVCREKADNSSGAAGAITVEVETGVVLMLNDGTATIVSPTHLGQKCYVQDDQTVGIVATDAGPIAGIVEEVTSAGAYVRIDGDTALPDVSTENVVAPGALSLLTKTTRLSVDGTDAFTLADGLYIGQLKYIVCDVADNTPAGTLTPTSLGVHSTILFDAIGESALLEWDGTNWQIIACGGATPA